MENIKILNFAIGGAKGHGLEIKNRADKIISFGKMTWSHIIARLMLVEQLYRVECILNNHPYHKWVLMGLKIRKPIVLCIMDGWGIKKNIKNNAIGLAKTPNYDELIKNFPSSFLEASGNFVGLPKNQIGNSEVGHMNIGSGRVILQSLPKIDKAFKENQISKNENLNKFLKKLNPEKSVHILGLCSHGGVHSHASHIIEMSKIISKKSKNVKLHIFSDGRDSLPNELSTIITKFSSNLPKSIKICSLIGRYYSMDRDNRWNRIKKAHDLIVSGKGNYNFQNIFEAIDNAYKRGETDEFISPTTINNYGGIEAGDSIIMTNFRADRVREILESLVYPNFNKFQRDENILPITNMLGMYQYSDKLSKYILSIFKNELYEKTLGEVISIAGLTQLRIAETEKYPHVTFFFNGGQEKRYKMEDRILIPSPKVATYDLKPEMSANKINKKLNYYIQKNIYDLIIVNFANPDMVGHTGNLEAAIKAVETVDKCVGKIKKSISKTNGILLLTSDHGNCECMWNDKNNSPHTAHTTNLVPFIMVSNIKLIKSKKIKLNNGKLADIAPTILDLLNIEKPKLMDGNSLIKSN